MKKQRCGIFLAVFLSAPFLLGAQQETRTGLYEIIPGIGAENAAPGFMKEMELRFNVYNRLFRFDPSLLPSPLRVRIFADKQAYDSYIFERLGDTRPGALYLHYNQADRREMVVHLGSAETAPMLAHQAFIQYLRAFVPNPPSWMREGFAIYFSTLRIIPPETVDYEENLFWLETVKSMGTRLPPVNTLLLADIAGHPQLSSEEFQIASWALVSFMLNSGWEYFRSLTESFMLLSPSAQTGENSQTIIQRLSLWNNLDTMTGDLRNYLAGRKTFRELMDYGHSAYSLGDFYNAELSFLEALNQRPSDFAPYYYLGLLYYEGKDYASAELYYLASLERGADEALINYALGINAMSAARRDDAVNYLQKAAALDPARYRTRVEDLIRRIEG